MIATRTDCYTKPASLSSLFQIHFASISNGFLAHRQGIDEMKNISSVFKHVLNREIEDEKNLLFSLYKEY